MCIVGVLSIHPVASSRRSLVLGVFTKRCRANFGFGSYCSSITFNLHEAHIKLYSILKKRIVTRIVHNTKCRAHPVLQHLFELFFRYDWCLARYKGLCSVISFVPVTNLLTPWWMIFFEKLIVIQLVKKYSAFFMEPKVSLPCSQKPATGPYPESAESSSPHRSLSP
jgi:hypothetical protein